MLGQQGRDRLQVPRHGISFSHFLDCPSRRLLFHGHRGFEGCILPGTRNTASDTQILISCEAQHSIQKAISSNPFSQGHTKLDHPKLYPHGNPHDVMSQLSGLNLQRLSGLCFPRKFKLFAEKGNSSSVSFQFVLFVFGLSQTTESVPPPHPPQLIAFVSWSFIRISALVVTPL